MLWSSVLRPKRWDSLHHNSQNHKKKHHLIEKPHDKNLIPGSKRHVLQRSFKTSVSVSRVTLRREAFENVK
jgi:hypothetical protein